MTQGRRGTVAWTRLGDEFAFESQDLTDAEFRTHVEALVWSNWRGLDLLIPKDNLRRFAESPDAAAAVDGLVDKGWWEGRGDCWYVGLRFPEWQRQRAAIEDEREGAALRARQRRMHDAGDFSVWRPRPDACELCGRSGVKLVFEHCHAHNQHRGWACPRCNATLRLVDKSPDDVRVWERAGERVWLYWLRCEPCAGRQTASPFPHPAASNVES